MIAMGKSMGLKLVAEGVETKEQVTYLQKQQCDFYKAISLVALFLPSRLFLIYKQIRIFLNCSNHLLYLCCFFQNERF